MKKFKIIAGIFWAFLCLILIIVLFPGLNNFSAATSKLTFMKINPRYTGGEAAGQVITPGCTLVIRKPVFSGLFTERKNGFVQLDWHGKLPYEIIDTIDYNFDKIPDFMIRINTDKKVSRLYPENNKVGRIIISTPTSYGWSVRVGLIK
jgi:hypothetical protein